MAKRVVEAHQTHIKALKMTIQQYKSSWDSKLKKLKRKFAFVVSCPVVLTDYLNELSASFEDGAHSRGQVEAGLTNEVELKSPRSDDSTGLEVKSPGRMFPLLPILRLMSLMPTPQVLAKKHTLRRDWFLRSCDVMLCLSKLK